ncbi:MAG: LysM peptidoglycan-binding domain-containing protein, partial [Deltaproteobacteria bacterium]|nr:LysM peptidoglycan-binding domain-containing protein [Deltaproteobacteria bacterium]
YAENIKNVPKKDRLSFHLHKVKSGESLWTISRKYNTPISMIVYLNNLSNYRLIREGSRLMIPIRAKASNSKRSYTKADIPNSGEYMVKSGDTLWSISSRYGIPLKELKNLNGLSRDNTIVPGQKLILRQSSLKKSNNKGS